MGIFASSNIPRSSTTALNTLLITQYDKQIEFQDKIIIINTLDQLDKPLDKYIDMACDQILKERKNKKKKEKN